MKAVILAGGLGSRLSEETENKPKPMVEIGGKPILWHIMKTYSLYGVSDFIICCGYKGYVIKEYFNNYYLHMSDVTFSLKNNTMKINNSNSEDWNVTLVDTGVDTMTGGRLKRIQKYLNDDEPFCFTYGDGVGDINISELISFHQNHKKLATITATRPPSRFGLITFGEKDSVQKFEEKPTEDHSWINGGFFILDKKAINYIKDDQTSWESEPLANLAKDNQLVAYKHYGFWRPMDTQRDKIQLNDLCNSNKAPWIKW
jgi:glucose-1-phosphate cytidylyltransferase